MASFSIIISMLLIACSPLAASESRDSTFPITVVKSLKELCTAHVALHTENFISCENMGALKTLYETLPDDLREDVCRVTIPIVKYKKHIKKFLEKYVWLTKDCPQFPKNFGLDQLTEKQIIVLYNLFLWEKESTKNLNRPRVIFPPLIQEVAKQWEKTVHFPATLEIENITNAIQLFSEFNTNHFIFSYNQEIDSDQLWIHQRDSIKSFFSSPSSHHEAHSTILKEAKTNKLLPPGATENQGYLYLQSLPRLTSLTEKIIK